MFKDIKAVFERDPAARGFWGFFEVIFTYAGFHAMMLYRLAHIFYVCRIPLIPRIIQSLARFFTGIEIHPAAKIGRGFFIDHGTGVVIGETTIIGDNVTLFQGVTLGGTGKEAGKRHPTLGNNIIVGAGAKVLGNIKIGDNVKIGSNSVVLSDVPDHSTVVGIPGRVVRIKNLKVSLDHQDIPDPIAERLKLLQERIDCLERHIKCADRKKCDKIKRSEKKL